MLYSVFESFDHFFDHRRFGLKRNKRCKRIGRSCCGVTGVELQQAGDSPNSSPGISGLLVFTTEFMHFHSILNF